MSNGSIHGERSWADRADAKLTDKMRASGFPQILFKIILSSVVLATCALFVGFWFFAARVEQSEAVLPDFADGIVVLTGGPDRIGEGMELLAVGRARRLLISGVGAGVSLEKLGKPMPHYKVLLDCCVDAEHEAKNTIGNALAAREWVRRKDYHSLIVVTSSYHLPRALVEFRRAMPDVALYSHPVNSDRQNTDHWWRDGAVARVIIMEYGKFLVAWCRMYLAGVLPG